MYERTPLEYKQWNSLVGKVYYQRCPDDKRYFRSIRIAFNAFTGGVTPQISNPVMGEPPEELEQINPLLLTRLLRNQMASQFC